MGRKVLNVFIASPSDVSDERVALRSISDRINKFIGRHVNVMIDLHGWEDTTPGYSRPQALINKDVEKCNLFIGVLWKRWGSNSGKFSSGFEEEFNIAQTKISEGDELDIWMFFKEIESGDKDDPGPQLSKVLKFQSELMDQKKIFFKEFNSTNDFEKLLYDILAQYLLENYSGETEVQTENLSVKLIENTSKNGLASDTSPSEQLCSVYNELVNSSRGEDFGNIPFWTRLRNFVSAQALFSDKHQGEVLDTHQINLVYRKRKEWKLCQHELDALLRGKLADVNEYIPGYFWLREYLQSGSLDYIAYLSTKDQNTYVRVGAIKLLNEYKYSPTVAFLEQIFNDKDVQVKLLSLDLAFYSESESILQFLEKACEDKNEAVKNKALSIYIDIMYRFDPTKSFQILIDKSSFTTPLYKEKLVSLDLNIEFSDLVIMGANADDLVRLFCAQYLNNSQQITKEIAEGYLSDNNSQIRKIGFIWLIDAGETFTIDNISKIFPEPKKKVNSLLSLSLQPDVTEDDIVPLLFQQYSKDEIEDLIEYITINGQRAYEVLATKYYKDVSDRLRNDLDNDFQDLISKSNEKLNSIYGKEPINVMDGLKDDIKVYLKRAFVSIALKGLIQDNNKKDIKYARKLLPNINDTDSKNSLIKLINKYGDERDVKLLMEISEEDYQVDMELLLSTMLKTCRSKLDLLNSIFDSDNSRLAHEASKNLNVLPRKEKIETYTTLLSSKHDIVRKEAASCLSELIGKLQIDCILDKYLESGSYYYDVVYILDKRMHKLTP